MDKRTQQQQQQRRRQQQQKQPSSPQYYTGVYKGFKENHQCCLTRSDVYAYVRETINKRKHEGDVSNVLAHIFESDFQEHVEYIRANIDKALITVGGEQPYCKRLSYHIKRINKIFNLITSLETEYKAAVSKYDGDKHHYERSN
ncbi:Late expression factor 11 lef-11 [Spodoptera exigua multiple nucleopolyhedrovirus]|nr:Late expression factor 11 lef-11 [Spodoptera exigua multiple nucleopolyhedrovirus]CDG72597.1 Late expression factor 11 lef-11 [Spodoptera exigua multiple nucleopolyhedrovirus]CDG72734.1 Late expression factor 11 lef-11 [Spodoptera exigua multiple nucleopolyhedrovirus]CDG72871.1 Late expression factor 11 lef-11 [Spodoptera exigua multiple nucleopolyhedrovirus]CDG73023.1 Late expression factor 11 lef-11 [Spodoptera exigua multiple nucleopolyhedrovirus]